MKNLYKIKYFLSFIFLCGISLTSKAFSKSDSLYAAGEYFEASIEYERLVFYAQNRHEANFYKYKKSLCYKNMGEFQDAVDELRQIYVYNVKDSLFCLVSYELSLCNLLEGNSLEALAKIDDYFHRSQDSSSFCFFLPIKIIALNNTLHWDEAYDCFLQLIDMQQFSTEKKQEIIGEVNELYKEKNIPRIRSEKKAKNWSRVIPGAGQVYAGSFGEGVLNLLINVTVLAFAGVEMYNHFYITGYLAGLGFFNKTYHGGIKRAGDLAILKNKKLIAEFNHKINQCILLEMQ
jgi:tetratricopeptide (TPR) repeat protein